MKKVSIFCIPAHGHTNPILPVAAELVRRGNTVRFYSFNIFESKIRTTGAEFVSCDAFMPVLTKKEEAGLKRVSATEMTLADIRITLLMNDFLEKEFQTFEPDVVYTDSVCFWGKLNAWKHKVPMVVSTSTFAFNQMSSQYMKNSPGEVADMLFGLPRISKELKKLEPYGYHIRNPLSLVQSDNDTDSIVYTSRRFQPYAESFSDHYTFVGPSIFSKAMPKKHGEGQRPLLYIALGTVINDRPHFYHRCIDALKDLEVDVLISCGNAIDIHSFADLPDTIQMLPYVDQPDVLSRADAFLTHCGMNSVSESLYMATPMILYPQTNEQKAVAKRVTEMHAGILLKDDSVEGLRAAFEEILYNETYRTGARECSEDFRSCTGASGAAEFIENAPHSSDGYDVIRELNRENSRFMVLYWCIVLALILILRFLLHWKFAWILGIIAGILSTPVGKWFQKRKYPSLIKDRNKKAESEK